MTYYEDVMEDAKDFIDHYLEDFKEEQDIEEGDDYVDDFMEWCDYDGKFHEWVDTIYNGYDAEEICDYSKNLETDYGLWHGKTDWREIRDAQAFWTLRNDFYIAVRKGVESILVEAEGDI